MSDTDRQSPAEQMARQILDDVDTTSPDRKLAMAQAFATLAVAEHLDALDSTLRDVRETLRLRGAR